MNTLAIDIGGTKFTLALFAGDRLIRRHTQPTDRAAGPAWMVSQIAARVTEWLSELPIDRCGIGFGGPVDFPTQHVTLSTHVGGWQGFPLVEQIRALLPNAPVLMDNDANVGALGEAYHGAGRHTRPLFYMTLSTGIGGGIIDQAGHVYRGADSYAGEIGHLTIRPNGPECLCGAFGCFERLCCGLWLERDYGQPAHVLLHDPQFVATYVQDLALGLKSAIMLLNPARLIIGGGISKAGETLFAPLRAELRRQITPWSRARLDVVPAALGDDSVLYGALVLAAEERKS